MCRLEPGRVVWKGLACLPVLQSWLAEGQWRVLRAYGLFFSPLSAQGPRTDWKYLVFDCMVLGLDIFALGSARTVRKQWEDGEDPEKWLENRFGGQGGWGGWAWSRV